MASLTRPTPTLRGLREAVVTPLDGVHSRSSADDPLVYVVCFSAELILLGDEGELGYM